jgi:MoaA/NifB/PqqE/SkfB family radical SAM enzyme
MSLELYNKIIDGAADHPYIDSVNLVGMGESFLNPNIFKMIDYAHEKSVDCYTCTNGKWKATEENLPSIIKLKHMHITIDGLTNDIYQLSRPKTDVHGIIENVKKIIRYKERVSSPTPHIQWKMVLFKFNKHQMMEVIDLCREINVDSVWICKGSAPPEVQTTLTDDEWEKLPHDYVFTSGFKQSDQSSTDEKTGLNRWRYKSGEKSLLDEIGCNGYTIRWDGAATPCCFDFDVSVKMGDLNSESLKSLWTESRVKAFEQAIFQNHTYRVANNRQILCDTCHDFLCYIKKCQSVMGMIKPDSTKPLSSIYKAIQYVNENKIGQAETICKQMLECNPHEFNALHLMGVIAYKKGHRRLSKRLIKQAIADVSITSSNFIQNLATLLREERKLNAADMCLTESEKLRNYAEKIIGI